MKVAQESPVAFGNIPCCSADPLCTNAVREVGVPAGDRVGLLTRSKRYVPCRRAPWSLSFVRETASVLDSHFLYMLVQPRDGIIPTGCVMPRGYAEI